MEISSVLFAAGRGKRLRPLTYRVPKPGLPVLDVPLAAWGLARLVRHAPPVVVNASHLGDELVAGLESLPISGWEPFLEGAEAYGTAGTLRALRERVGPRLVTWNGDALTDLQLPDLIAAHSTGGGLATLLVKRVKAMADLELDGDSVTGFIDRRVTPDAAGARFLGIAVFERAALARLPDQRPSGLGETLLRGLAESGDLNAYVFDGYLRDVGTPSEYLQASLDVLNGVAPARPAASPGRVIEVEGGLAYAGPDARAVVASIGSGAILLAGSEVETGAHVTDSIVFPGTPVPAGTNLERAIWFDGLQIPS